MADEKQIISTMDGADCGVLVTNISFAHWTDGSTFLCKVCPRWALICDTDSMRHEEDSVNQKKSYDTSFYYDRFLCILLTSVFASVSVGGLFSLGISE